MNRSSGSRSSGWVSRRGALLRAAAHCSLPALALAALGAEDVAAQGTSPAAAAPRPGAQRVLLIVGDSLSAEYGLARGTGWVALLEQRITREQLPWRVVNASISGDTTSGGRARLPALVLIELGGNDALRGLPLADTRANLVAMSRASRAAGARVLIAGMMVPPNYGRRYGEEFFALFGSVAQAEQTALVPFLLAGVADGPQAETLFQPDRIHPTAQAQPRMLDNVWPVLRPLLLAR